MPGIFVAESNRGTAVPAVPYAAWLRITPSVTVNWIELLLLCVACSSAVVSARCRCYASSVKSVAVAVRSVDADMRHVCLLLAALAAA